MMQLDQMGNKTDLCLP